MEQSQGGHRERATDRFPVESVAFAFASVVVFVAGRWLAEGSTAGAVIQTLGAGGILLSPLIWRAEGMLTIGPKGIMIPLAARGDRRMRAVLSAAGAPDENMDAIALAAKAPHRALAGVLPFLAGDVSSEVLSVPPALEGQRFKDEPLQFVRQDLQLSVVALREAGESEWKAGGVVSTTPLQTGMKLLVCGPASAIETLRQRFDEM